MMPEFDEIYRGYIDKEGDKEFFNLKKYSSRKYLNTFKNIRKFFSKDEDQEEILNLAEKQKQKYDFYEKERDQFLNIKEGKANAEEILEKYVILNHLIGKETQLYLQENINPFQVTIYH